ncbi:MAG: enoyl-ACP reductase [Chloroflexota bacterium]
MKLLEGKTALIFGLANQRSIAWGIAQAFHEHGAQLGFSYAVPQLERRVRPLAEQIGVTFVEQCDVTQDAEIETVFAKAAKQFGTIDILVHAIAFAERADLEGRFYDTSRAGFATAMNISVYSLVALSRAALPLMPNGGSILSLSYYGAEKVVPHYNVMGVAKAALEASTRYLAADLGPQGIRVNAISAGPIKTLSAAGIAGFRKILGYVEERAPLRRNVDQDEVGRTALWLGSDLASGVTGEVIYVDAGYHILGMPEPPESWE